MSVPTIHNAPADGALIEAPGLYDISEADYHADRFAPVAALSSSIARTLLNESPRHAWFEHPRLVVEDEEDEEDDDTTKTMDVGAAAHAMVLGRGADLVIIDAKNYQTKAAKEARDEARAVGKTPILAKQHKRLLFARAALHRQMEAFEVDLPGLFTDATLFEHVVYWREGDIWCRAMLDAVQFLPDVVNIVDYKSTETSANPQSFSRQAANMGYDFQLAWYRRGLRRILGPNDRRPIRCFLLPQERAKPYAMSVIEAGPDALDLGDKMGAAALAIWSQCMASGEWPAYPPFVATMSLPNWRETQWLEREVADDQLAGAGWRFALPLSPDKPRDNAEVLVAG